MANACDRNEQTELKIGESIAERGKTIQKKSLESLDLGEQLVENGSTEVFAESVQAHIEAMTKNPHWFTD